MHKHWLTWGAPLLPSIFTNASQALVTAGPTLISLKYLFQPSPQQIAAKHKRLFRASANALETFSQPTVEYQAPLLGFYDSEFLDAVKARNPWRVSFNLSPRFHQHFFSSSLLTIGGLLMDVHVLLIKFQKQQVYQNAF